MTSWQTLMELSAAQTQQNKAAVESVLADRQRREAQKRKELEDKERRERELEAKLRIKRLEEQKREQERQARREKEKEAKEREYADGQRPNMIEGVWHCSNCGCPESIAIGRRKGPLGDKSQCGACGEYRSWFSCSSLLPLLLLSIR